MTKEYRREIRGILRDLGIWNKLTDEEKVKFKTCQSEIQMQQLQVTFRHKYL